MPRRTTKSADATATDVPATLPAAPSARAVTRIAIVPPAVQHDTLAGHQVWSYPSGINTGRYQLYWGKQLVGIARSRYSVNDDVEVTLVAVLRAGGGWQAPDAEQRMTLPEAATYAAKRSQACGIYP